MFNGCVVDVNKLLQQIERSEKSRVHIEEKMVQLEKTLGSWCIISTIWMDFFNKSLLQRNPKSVPKLPQTMLAN